MIVINAQSNVIHLLLYVFFQFIKISPVRLFVVVVEVEDQVILLEVEDLLEVQNVCDALDMHEIFAFLWFSFERLGFGDLEETFDVFSQILLEDLFSQG